MTRRALSSLGVLVRERRGARKLREVAQEIGIGPATLMRIESGRIPDVATFGKVCKWLAVDPGEFLGFDSKSHEMNEPISISAHFKAEATPKPETVHALARMLQYVMKHQPRVKDAADNGDV
jgi:transcriptional regulator with XRE-family HTH domain